MPERVRHDEKVEGLALAPPRISDAADRASWILLGAMLVAILDFADRLGFGLDLIRAVPAALVVALLVAAWRIGLRRGMPRLAAGAVAFLQMTLFTLLGVVLAYVIAASAGVTWDTALAAADRSIGIDWRLVRAVLDRWPATIVVLGIAYHSLTVQMIVVIVALAAASGFERLQIMVCAAILSGFVTILISAGVPAFGNLFDPANYRHLWPSIAWLEHDLIAHLRDGSLRTLDLAAPMGIVSFPSFHATLAAIFVWALRPVPRLRLPGSAWAGLTIVATPVFGGHYAVDVIAGLLLAPPAILIAKRLVPSWPDQSAAAIVAAAAAAPPPPAISAAIRRAERV